MTRFSLVLIALAAVACDGNAVTCAAVCGGDTDTLSGRCAEAFGTAYSCPVASADVVPDDCKSLSALSPGLTLACNGQHVDVLCCGGP